MELAKVHDARGQKLSPCPAEKAYRLIATGRATLVSDNPLTIRLHSVITLPEPKISPDEKPLQGQRLLLHICCAPCATYTVARLRTHGAIVSGHWYNPNIHPFAEHERRRESLSTYAREIELPMIWATGYEMPRYFRAIVGHESPGERCRICYRLRLEATARAAAESGIRLFSTTLLISPYQDQRGIRQLGEELAHAYGLSFYFENFRQGFAEHHRIARAQHLYRQRYCGCLYSEWEAHDRGASPAAQQ